MSVSTKDKIKRMIRQKTMKRKKYRTALAKEKGPEKIIKQFLRDFDIMRTEVQSALAFDMGLDDLIGTMDREIRLLDEFARIEIVWAGDKDGEGETWEQLNVNGVRIRWGRTYREENSILEEMTYIDVGHLFMDSLLGED